MSRTVKAVPEGQHTVTPSLIARDAVNAIEFYKRAFGAAEVHRVCCPETGKLMHGELKIGDSRVYLCDEFPEMGCRAPQTLGGSAVSISLYVENADATAARAVEAGATLTMPVAEMFWGDRFGKLTDPFGHQWTVATHVVDLTPEQIAGRMAEQMAEHKARKVAAAC